MLRSQRYRSLAKQMEEQALLLESIGNNMVILVNRIDRLRWVAEEAARLMDAERADRLTAARNLQTAMDNLLPGDVPALDKATGA